MLTTPLSIFHCREVQYTTGADGHPLVTGLLVGSGTNTHVVKADVYVAALDVPGAKRLIPTDWRKYDMFDKLHTLVGVPVITVQLRYNGWVTEMKVRVASDLARTCSSGFRSAPLQACCPYAGGERLHHPACTPLAGSYSVLLCLTCAVCTTPCLVLANMHTGQDSFFLVASSPKEFSLPCVIHVRRRVSATTW